jgi:uncharacterized membrane protein
VTDNPENGRPAQAATVGNDRDSTSTPVQFRGTYQQVIEYHRSAPLPPPAELQEYERVLPGLADRIVKMAETEGDKRRYRDQYVLTTQRVSLYVAAVVSIVFFVGGFYVVLEGKEIAGLVSLVTALVVLSSAFIVGKRANVEIAKAEADLINGAQGSGSESNGDGILKEDTDQK